MTDIGSGIGLAAFWFSIASVIIGYFHYVTKESIVKLQLGITEENNNNKDFVTQEEYSEFVEEFNKNVDDLNKIHDVLEEILSQAMGHKTSTAYNDDVNIALENIEKLARQGIDIND